MSGLWQLCCLAVLIGATDADVRANTIIQNDSNAQISVLTVFVNFGEKNGLGGEPNRRTIMPGAHVSHRYRSPFALAGEEKPELKLQFALAGTPGNIMQWVTVPPDCNVVAKDGADGGIDIYRAKAVAPKQADGPLLATVRP